MSRSPTTLTLLVVLSLLSPELARADPFERCLETLRRSRIARGLSAGTWEQLRGARPDSAVLSQLNAQPEFTLPVWDYVAVMVDQGRIDDGVRFMQEYKAAFDSVSRQYGVDASVVASIWGIESNFGRGMGTNRVLKSLATLSCAGRRQRYFRGELVAALRIVQAGHVRPEDFLGSWAGAFGQTQFMPGIFSSRAVDFDGDGRRDLIRNSGDALASAANYLRLAGWRSGVPWGIEVRLPEPANATFDAGRSWRRVRHPIAVWVSRGLRRADGSRLSATPLDSRQRFGLFTPAGPSGPAFLVSRNFEAVYRYNASVNYTLAILHLADRLRGGAPFVAGWPTDDPGLSRADRRELQALLIARGHPISQVDGLLLPITRAAVRVEQQRIGHPVTGRPGQRLLAALRAP